MQIPNTLKQLLRPAWYKVVPYQLAVKRRFERARIRVAAMPAKWLREPWPPRLPGAASPGKVAIVTVNYNTAERLAHLLFSLYRILGRDQFHSIVVVDNASSDSSRQLLHALHRAGLVEVILNE